MSDTEENVELFVDDNAGDKEAEPVKEKPAKKKRVISDERKAQLLDQLKRGREKAAANRKAKKEAKAKEAKVEKPKEEVKEEPKRETKKENKNDYGELLEVMKGMKSELNELKEMKKAKRKAKAEEKAKQEAKSSPPSAPKPLATKPKPVIAVEPKVETIIKKPRVVARGKFDYSQYFQ